MEAGAAGHDELDYVGGGLPKTTNWWGAFVIGLAGTILVTGIAPVMVTSLGAAAIPSIFIITCSGWLLCLFLAELSAMMPDRSGGSPSYAYPAYKERWPRFAEHVNGFTAWALLARLVPGRAAEHDPGVVLHRLPAEAEHDSRVHADRHADRLVDGRASPSAASCCSSSPPTGACASARSSRPRSRSSR